MNDDPTREQPGSDDGLEEIAVDLITGLIQKVFEEMDPLRLVEQAGLDLSDEDKRTVAHLIDHASVEVDIDFDDEGSHSH